MPHFQMKTYLDQINQIIKRHKMSYAIVFDLDQSVLKDLYHVESYNNAYKNIETILLKYGFSHEQGSAYFGNGNVTAVTCFLAVREISTTYEWFKPSVKDIRMLRIEETNDLKPIL